MIVAAIMLGLAPAVAPAVPPGLQFGFFRMAAFRQRARDSGCGSGPLDEELDVLRTRLAGRYGKKTFAWPKVPKTAAGECMSILSIYRANLIDFHRESEAALAAPVAP